MTQFGRTKILLGGFDGAPGVNILNWCAPAHLDIDQPDVDNWYEILEDALDTVSGYQFASGVTITLDPTTTVHEVDSGDLVGVFATTRDPYTFTGVGSGSESRATQAGIRWLTNDFRFGRRVQGRMFMGPLASDTLDGSGKLSSATLAVLDDAFTGLVDGLGPRLIVWSRPSTAHPTGAYSDVASYSVSSKPFTLRGRRD